MDSKKDKLFDCVYLKISALIFCPSKKLEYARIHPNDVQVGAVVWRLGSRDKSLQKPSSA